MPSGPMSYLPDLERVASAVEDEQLHELLANAAMRLQELEAEKDEDEEQPEEEAPAEEEPEEVEMAAPEDKPKGALFKRELVLFQKEDGSDIWMSKVLCVASEDRQKDSFTPEEVERIKARLDADIAAGNLVEMGVNHETEPSPALKALEAPIVAEDVEVNGAMYHKGDLVLVWQAFGERQKAMEDGRGRGVSLEGYIEGLEEKGAETAENTSEVSTAVTNAPDAPPPTSKADDEKPESEDEEPMDKAVCEDCGTELPEEGAACPKCEGESKSAGKPVVDQVRELIEEFKKSQAPVPELPHAMPYTPPYTQPWTGTNITFQAPPTTVTGGTK